MKYYIAYGSNMSFAQMAQRCQNAVPVGTGVIKNWKLVFKYHATIEPCADSEVPVGVWKIDDRDEKRLDRYEGFPDYYKKCNMTLMVKTFKGHHKLIRGMVYVMRTGQPISPPNPSYYYGIKDGYADFRIENNPLSEALCNSISGR